MAGENTISTANGMFKTQYAKKLVDAVPSFAILQKRIDFVASDKMLGAFYAQPVVLTQESGFTAFGTTGAVGALNAASNAVMKEAQVYGSELVLRTQASYKALASAVSAGERAFKKFSGWMVENMNSSTRRRLEIAMLYGQSGLGTVASAVSGQVITLTEGSWSGAIWAGSEGTAIDVYQSDLATVRQASLTISAVNQSTRAITVTGTVTGITTDDVLFFKGHNASGTFKEMAGLKKIITNSGSLFGIDASAYSLWKGTSNTSFGELNHTKLQDFIAKLINMGLAGDVTVMLSPKGFAKLNGDQAALRVFDSSYKPSQNENGSEALKFHGANGSIEIVAHPYVKDGDAFIVPLEDACRIGSTDLSFTVGGMDHEYFRLVDGYNAVELQCFADQAIFLEKPAHAGFLGGITYA